MESFLNRYRNITVLLLVIFAQLVLLAAQVKNDQDVRVIRLWAITTVTPAARVAEWFRGGSVGFFRRYVMMHEATEENRRLRDEVGRLRLENIFLHNELNTADRAKALQVFQQHTQSKMLAANVISVSAGSNAKAVFVNRGSAEGVMRGMAVVTPEGIVGKVIAAYPTAAQVLLVTDPEFSAGVVSQKTGSHGILKGQGNNPLCKVDYVPFEDKIEPGEWFYTSGDDRVFPRGFPVGVVKVVRPGAPFKEVLVEPSGVQHGVQDVLIILESVHQAIPDAPPANQPVYISPAPPAAAAPAPSQTAADGTAAPPPGTEADKLREIYKSAGEAQNHTYGTGLPGSKPPDFKNLPATPGGPAKAPAAAKPPAPAQNAPAGEASPAPRLQRQNVEPGATVETPPKSPVTTPKAVPKTPAEAPAKNPAAPPKGPGGAARE
jgi:rod shape-determining protein MreC